MTRLWRVLHTDATRADVRSQSFGIISRVDGRYALVDGDQPMPGPGAGSMSRIYLFDLHSNELAPLTEGRLKQYVPDHRKFLFTRDIGSYPDNRTYLYLADLDRPREAAKPVAPQLTFGSGQDTRVIQVGPDAVILSALRGTDSANMDLYRFDLNNEKIEPLPALRDCTPIIWRSATHQLLCRSVLQIPAKWLTPAHQEYEYTLTDLDGRNVRQVELPFHYSIIAYLPEFDALLLNGSKGLTPKAILVYIFRTGKFEMVTEGYYGWSGAFWHD